MSTFSGIAPVDFPLNYTPYSRGGNTLVKADISVPITTPVGSTMAGTVNGTSAGKYLYEYKFPRDMYDKFSMLSDDISDDFSTAKNTFGFTNMSRVSDPLGTGYVMRTMSIGNGGGTNGYAYVTATAPSSLEINYFVRSEAGYDKFYIYINGSVVVNGISGSGSYTTRTFSIPAGTSTIRFYYKKDGSVSRLQDAGFVKSMRLVPGNGTATSSNSGAYDVALKAPNGDVYYYESNKWNKSTFDLAGTLDAYGSMYVYQIPLAAFNNFNGDFTLVIRHSQNIFLNILATQEIPYRYTALVDGVTRLPQSGTLKDPISIEVPINEKDLEGKTTATVTVRLSINGSNYNYTHQVTVSSQPPSVSLEMLGRTYSLEIKDLDGDKYKYRILLNDKQYFPSYDTYTDYQSEATLKSELLRSDIVTIGVRNKLTVVAVDYFGVTVTTVKYFIPTYEGLIFSDEQNKNYSDDIGTILQLLQLQPILISGASTNVTPVRLHNKMIKPVTDLRINLRYTLDNIELHISKEQSPFIASKELFYGSEELLLNPEEYITFYVRAQSHHRALVGGDFEILAEAREVSYQ